MKHTICWICILTLIIYVIPVSASAAQQEIIYLEDGGHITVHTVIIHTRGTQSVTGNKVYTYYDGDDNMDWKAVLSGTFTYTGSSSTCTASSVSVTVYDSAWYTISKSAGKNSNNATGSISMGEKLLGVTMKTVPVGLILSCDVNGNLS